jgi:hypothetical protein
MLPLMFRALLPKCSPAICVLPFTILAPWLTEDSDPCRMTSNPMPEEESLTTQLDLKTELLARMLSRPRRSGLRKETVTSRRTPMNTVTSANSYKTKSLLEVAREAIFHLYLKELRIMP